MWRRFSGNFLAAAMVVAVICTVPARSPGSGQDNHMIGTAPGVAVYYPANLHGVAGEIRDSYPEIKAAAENVLGWEMIGTVSIVLAERSSLFEMSAGTPHIVAYAVPRKNLIVVDHQKLQAHPFTLRSVVMHELFHLILHRHIPAGLLPRWFEEGVCQWASDGLGEILSGGRVLDRAVIRGDLLPFRFIERAFPRDPAAMRLAYEQSKSFVIYLVGLYGRESLMRILESMKAGNSFGSAVEAVLGMSADRIEEDWRNSLTGRDAWISLVAYHLYRLIFGLAAVLAVAGFIRVMIKKRRALREYDEREEMRSAPEDGEW